MGLDATPIGIQIFFIIVLPGFMFFVSFRKAAGYREKVGELGSVCAAAFFGVLLYFAIQHVRGAEEFNKLIATPISAGFSLAVVGLVSGFILGLPLGWVRSRLR